MTDKNLKGIVEEAAGIDRLTKAYTIARDRANAMTARLDRATAQADNAVSLITSTESEIETSSAAVSSWEKTEDRTSIGGACLRERNGGESN